MSDRKERIQYIDAVKGFGMMLIILGHNPIPETLKDWLYSFHVPLFFIIAGIFFKKESFKSLLTKNFRYLIIPLLFTELVAFVGLSAIFLRGNYSPGFYVDLFWRQLCCIGDKKLPCMWFLWALFWAKLNLYILEKYIPKYSLLVAMILFLLSLYIPHYVNLSDVPFLFVQGLSCTLFLKIGNLIGSYLKQMDITKIHLGIIASSILFVVLCSYPIEANSCKYPLGILNVVLSSLLSLIIVLWFATCEKYSVQNILFQKVWRFFCFFRHYSLIILCLHCWDRTFQLWRYLPNPGSFYVGPFWIIVHSCVALFILKIPFLRTIYCYKK